MRALLLLLLPLLCAGTAQAQHWSRSWAAAPLAALPPQAGRPAIPDLADRTLRQVVRLSTGGDRLRLRLTNELSDIALTTGAVHVALAGADGAIVAGTDRVVRFDGQAAARLPAYAPLVSAPIALPVPPRGRIAISIHLPAGAPRPTVHQHAAATTWIARGDQTAAVRLADPERFGQRLLIAAIDVETRARHRVIVAFGDSITDGVRATPDADTRYPDRLVDRLQAAGLTRVGVANMGISGNRLLDGGTGPTALARFDRDVLAVPGVSDVIVLEGVNDIGAAVRDGTPLPTPDALIGGFRQLIARSRDRGIRIRFATILPYKGAGYWSAAGEAVRVAVNRWIRTSREHDGAIDFDRAIRDPADPARMAAAYDGGDHLHPGDAGYAAMAAAVDLTRYR